MADKEMVAATLTAGLVQARATMLAQRVAAERETSFIEIRPDIVVAYYKQILRDISQDD